MVQLCDQLEQNSDEMVKNSVESITECMNPFSQTIPVTVAIERKKALSRKIRNMVFVKLQTMT